ncbi:hypothetical protein CDL12_11255 [Handroanthus impetiginosus]|nr:hypothetical protein CDL12_11255 [Handroanthus impetiginosus]
MVAVVLTVVVCILPCCCRCFCTCFNCCCSLCCRGRRLVKMMKAPGRNFQMPRRDFEIDPKGYFQNLRSHPGDKLC